MLIRNLLLTCLAAMLLAAPASAAAVFKITEAYTGVSGSDGTPDWFELTNLGDMTGSTAGLFYDDDSADPTNNFALPGFTVAPGEAVVVLIEAQPEDIATFYSFWGVDSGDVQVGVTGGGSLGQGGDAVNVFAGNFPGATLVDSLAFGGALGGQPGTIEDITGNGPLGNSQLGVNSAFMSVGVSGVGQLIGSPGVSVPEPATMALATFGFIGALVARRRRAA